MQISKKIARLKRRYARVTAYKFFYNRDTDLRRRESEINCWILIHSNAYGYSLIEDLKFKYQIGRTAPEWSAALDPKQGWIGKKDGERWSLFRVFIEKILPSINKNKAPHEQWRFHSFVGFAYDLRKHKDSPVSQRTQAQSSRRAQSGDDHRVRQ